MLKNEIKTGRKKLLLSGGTGFLGSHISRYFLEKGYQVTILKRESSSLDKLSNQLDQIKLVNVNNFEGGEFDLFIHAATVYGRRGESSAEMIEGNINFPLDILSKLNLEKLHFINLGTSLPEKFNLYSETKHDFVKKACSRYPSLMFTNLILEQFYGPHDGTIISLIIKALKSGDSHINLTAGDQVRDFIYYEDVLDAIYITSKKSSGGNFPVGSGEAITFRKMAELIKKMFANSQTKLCFGAIDYRENEIMNSLAQIDKLKGLGWSPRFNIEAGLRKTLANW